MFGFVFSTNYLLVLFLGMCSVPLKSRLVVLLTNVLSLSSGLEGMENQLVLCLTSMCCCLIARKLFLKKKEKSLDLDPSVCKVWTATCKLAAEGYTLKHVQRNQAFFGRAGWQTLKILFRGYGYREHRYQLFVLSQALCFRFCVHSHKRRCFVHNPTLLHKMTHSHVATKNINKKHHVSAHESQWNSVRNIELEK